jgi:hypothetical protein
MTTLSEDLTQKILPILAEKELVLAEDVERYAVKLAAGKMKAEDWRLLVEKGMDKKVAK